MVLCWVKDTNFWYLPRNKNLDAAIDEKMGQCITTNFLDHAKQIFEQNDIDSVYYLECILFSHFYFGGILNDEDCTVDQLIYYSLFAAAMVGEIWFKGFNNERQF